MNLTIFGEHEQQVIDQLERCVAQEDGSIGVLCADGHFGYSAPIGGVVAYRDHVSPAAVGYDIGCGNLAVATNLIADVTFHAALPGLMDRVFAEVSFGMGRRDGAVTDHPVFDRIAHADFEPQRDLLDTARKQLGTVGAGNHYVDVFAAWREQHGGEWFYVIRKGATPAFPGQKGFVGATMSEPAVILEGLPDANALQAAALYSTVHGAGRAMSRTAAAGKNRKRWTCLNPNCDWVQQPEEAPGAYKRLNDVLAAHAGTIRILHTLTPLGVAMAPSDTVDPFKD